MLAILICMPVWGSAAKAQTLEPYAVFNETTGTLTFKCNDEKPSNAYPLNKDTNRPLWITNNRNAIKTVVFDASFAQARPPTCYSWFLECKNLTEIKGIKNLNTEKVTNMYRMFSSCEQLTSLDVSNFSTENVTNMSNMFDGCKQLTSLDVSNFNTRNVTGMSKMFSGCKKLASLDVSNFSTENVTNMSNMFSSCEQLTSLDVSNFKTEKVTTLNSMFWDCGQLTSLDVSNFNTKNVTGMTGMFCGCGQLTSLDVSNFKTEKVTNMGSMFNGCKKLTSLDVSNFNTENVTSMSSMFSGCWQLTSLDLSNFNTNKVRQMSYMFYLSSNLKTIYASDMFVTTKIQGSLNMFKGCTSLKGAIAYDENKIDYRYANYKDGYFTQKAQTLEPYAVFDETTGTLTFKCNDEKPSNAYSLNEDTNEPLWITNNKNAIKTVVFDASFAKARPTTCYYWFRECTKLTEIKGIDNLNTEKVTNMNSMFCGTFKLTSLDVSNFNTENVTDMDSMFCSSHITSLDVSNFNTENVTSMGSMFWSCGDLTSLDVSNFNTTKVTNMQRMFSWCIKLKSLDVSKFNTTNVTNMSAMFAFCPLTSLDVSNFNTTNVTDMGGMFAHCSLTSIDVSNFNTEKVTNMGSMFSYNTKLTSLDVSNFNTENVTNMYEMFSYNSNLKTIYASDMFVTTKVQDSNDMFKGCRSLKGAIAYDESKVDHRYANYKDGYFTQKTATAISSPTAANNETTDYFNLQGIRTDNMHKGINIVRHGNKTTKVLVK